MPRKWLEVLRKDKKMTMKEVAYPAGVAESTYSLIESGKRTPHPKAAKRIAAVLDFDWTRFYEDEEELEA